METQKVFGAAKILIVTGAFALVAAMILLPVIIIAAGNENLLAQNMTVFRIDVSQMSVINPNMYEMRTANEKLRLHLLRPKPTPAPTARIKRVAPAEETCSLTFMQNLELFPVRYETKNTLNATMLSMLDSIQSEWTTASGVAMFTTASRTLVSTTQGILRNNLNQLSFGRIILFDGETEITDALGVTAIWSTYADVVIEWDMTINTYHYCLIDAGTYPWCYDLWSVILHEFGHVVGWEDLYETIHDSMVMYGYLDVGTTWGRAVDNVTAACTAAFYSAIPYTPRGLSPATVCRSFLF